MIMIVIRLFATDMNTNFASVETVYSSFKMYFHINSKFKKLFNSKFKKLFPLWKYKICIFIM